ncbi:MAG: SGNH/GDSL hydrolase family protein [bacterium]|nr:SGNH/GDSL hydrolase family protein [bacterium]
MWQPTRWAESCSISKEVFDAEGALPGGDFTSYKRNIKLIYAAVVKRLGSKSYFMDMSRSLCDRRGPAYRQDGVHLLPQGRQLIANKLAETLPEFLQETK